MSSTGLRRQLAQVQVVEVRGVGQQVADLALAQAQALHKLQRLGQQQQRALARLDGGQRVERELRQRVLGQRLALHQQPRLAAVQLLQIEA